MAKNTKTICIDFDGVIHAYSRGRADGSIYDAPVAGAFKAIQILLQNYNVVILSTRDPKEIKKWFDFTTKESGYVFTTEIIPVKVKYEWTKEGVIGITNRKMKAMFYIDDRGLRFTNWRDILNYVR